LNLPLGAREPKPVLLELFPYWGMCYNRPAVEHAVKPGAAPVPPEPAESASSQLDPHAEQSASQEDASQYCPVCSQRLESRRCKLICAVCGYYMSCSDYY
jgi:hypothetical protein